jgi:hypothetical protein
MPVCLLVSNCPQFARDLCRISMSTSKSAICAVSNHFRNNHLVWNRNNFELSGISRKSQLSDKWEIPQEQQFKIIIVGNLDDGEGWGSRGSCRSSQRKMDVSRKHAKDWRKICGMLRSDPGESATITTFWQISLRSIHLLGCVAPQTFWIFRSDL